ncbi:hypothetical protein [Klebsiella quasipneumoniae]|uniref:hypothetical protein n=1 Tax=Klebsiella quasipneumoniae TaxID=1463165 RepID=UPI00237C80AE|nr:hypothetical protein [Klebsiella quasipneumoniae]MDE1587414.1 hypothetical protein [Klebsiella quasipneumoniae]MDE1598158.1 hypothetical protein [Klebsiella quasipneumoniae]MDE1603443.1 hypothetical protein [Klebsiella quasipneumoniae]MDE1608741.1 hypothetical protein [Klebsiella quasipneumoniae]MDE1614155.1 hypothetical protein [Klebsiella quasipneumoniae]
MALVVTGADFFRGPPVSDFLLFDVMNTNPAKDGLLGSYFLGKKNADPTYNFANPELPLIQHGEPDITDYRHARLGRNLGYFDTQIPSQSSITILNLGRQPASGKIGVAVSSYMKDTSGNASGDTIIKNWSGTVSRVGFYAQDTAASVKLATRDDGVVANEYSAFGGLVTTAGTTVGVWSMNETTDPGFTSLVIGTRAVSGRTLLLGATYSDAEFLSTMDLSATLIYSGDIGGTNVRAVMNWLRNTVGVAAGIWSAPRG